MNRTTATRFRVQGWHRDIDFLQAAVVKEHYLFRTKPLPENFRKRAEELKSSIARLSDEQLFAELQRLMTTLGDGHCYVAPSPSFMQKSPLQELPLRLHGFSDGLFVIDANPNYERWIGHRIMRLGPVSAEDALWRVAEYIPKDNIQAARWRAPLFLGYRGPLEALGCVGSKAQEIAWNTALRTR
jgi:hypothetical protein